MGCSLDAPARDLTTAVRKQNEAAIRKRLFEARGGRAIERGQCRRLHPLPIVAARWPVYSGGKWIKKGGTQRTAQMALRHLGY
jgi:hypothetical protein